MSQDKKGLIVLEEVVAFFDNPLDRSGNEVNLKVRVDDPSRSVGN